MRDIVQALSQLCKEKHSRNNYRSSPAAADEVSVELDELETPDYILKEHPNDMHRMHSR